MELYRRLVFPLAARLDAESSHHLTLRLLELAQQHGFGRTVLRAIAGPLPDDPVSLFGLTFPNLLGAAAGFDKNARVFPSLALLGFGHVEVGTVTPRPQAGNPRPRLFRLPEDHALINRLGFPNAGAEAAAGQLQRRLAILKQSATQQRVIVGVSLGKQKETPLAAAADDYRCVMGAVYRWADYLAVNVSSPNTPELRDLQQAHYLPELLEALVGERQRLAAELQVAARPLLVKIAPDLTPAEVEAIVAACLAAGVEGIIATNTTVTREGIRGRAGQESGGLSGRPLAERSNAIIRLIHQQAGPRLPIIGVGGIFNAEGVRAKLDAGASLVQLYTGLVYEGPGLAGRLLRDLARPSAPKQAG